MHDQIGIAPDQPRGVDAQRHLLAPARREALDVLLASRRTSGSALAPQSRLRRGLFKNASHDPAAARRFKREEVTRCRASEPANAPCETSGRARPPRHRPANSSARRSITSARASTARVRRSRRSPSALPRRGGRASGSNRRRGVGRRPRLAAAPNVTMPKVVRPDHRARHHGARARPVGPSVAKDTRRPRTRRWRDRLGELPSVVAREAVRRRPRKRHEPVCAAARRPRREAILPPRAA